MLPAYVSHGGGAGLHHVGGDGATGPHGGGRAQPARVRGTPLRTTPRLLLAYVSHGGGAGHCHVGGDVSRAGFTAVDVLSPRMFVGLLVGLRHSVLPAYVGGDGAAGPHGGGRAQPACVHGTPLVRLRHAMLSAYVSYGGGAGLCHVKGGGAKKYLPCEVWKPCSSRLVLTALTNTTVNVC